MTQRIGNVLGVEIGGGRMSLDVRTFLTQLEPSGTTDPQRLFLHLSLDGPGGESTIRFYLPGLISQRDCTGNAETPALPGHLDGVPVEIGAQLGSLEVSLADLMKVEVGDVIPLGLLVGDPLEIMVEERPAGKASWGNYRGRLALRIEHLDSEREGKQS